MTSFTQGQHDGFQKAITHIDTAHTSIHGVHTGLQTTLEAAAQHYQTSAGRTVQAAGTSLQDVITTLKTDLQAIGEKIGVNAHNYGNAGQNTMDAANRISSLINNLRV